jgi:hypothetical protein
MSRSALAVSAEIVPVAIGSRSLRCPTAAISAAIRAAHNGQDRSAPQGLHPYALIRDVGRRSGRSRGSRARRQRRASNPVLVELAARPVAHPDRAPRQPPVSGAEERSGSGLLRETPVTPAARFAFRLQGSQDAEGRFGRASGGTAMRRIAAHEWAPCVSALLVS